MNVRWMRTMDLCAGAGALSWGFQLSGAFNPLWAIEKDLSCAKTYRCVHFVVRSGSSFPCIETGQCKLSTNKGLHPRP